VLELPLERVAVDEGRRSVPRSSRVAAQIWPDVGTAVAATVRPGERIEPSRVVEVYRERARATRRSTRAARSAG